MEEVGSGVVKGLAITFLGVLSLAMMGGLKMTANASAYAALDGPGNPEIIGVGIVLIGLITTIIYYFARE